MSRYAKCGFVLRFRSSSASFDSIAAGWDGEEKSGLGFILAQQREDQREEDQIEEEEEEEEEG